MFKKIKNNEKDIEEWLKKYNKNNYIINSDLTVDFSDNINLSFNSIKKIPFKFNKVKGDFSINNSELYTLNNCPSECNRLYCSSNKLSSLEGCPKR